MTFSNFLNEKQNDSRLRHLARFFLCDPQLFVIDKLTKDVTPPVLPVASYKLPF